MCIYLNANLTYAITKEGMLGIDKNFGDLWNDLEELY